MVHPTQSAIANVIDVKHIPGDASKREVIHAIASILHSSDFNPRTYSQDPLKRLNFRVDLEVISEGSLKHQGRGTLCLPWKPIAEKFLQHSRDHPISINGSQLRFYWSPRLVDAKVARTICRTYYVDPIIEERRQEIIFKLNQAIPFTAVQFGRLHREDGNLNRSYSIEWEHKRDTEALESFKLDYDKKAICVELGNQNTELERKTIVVKFATIRRIAIGYDPHPYICFDTSSPPILESSAFHRTETGRRHVDTYRIKEPISSLNPRHAAVAPYATHLRITLFDYVVNKSLGHTGFKGPVDLFETLWTDAGLPSNIIVKFKGPRYKIETAHLHFFEPHTIRKLQRRLAQYPWPIAFQMEALLSNGVLHTKDIDKLINRLPHTGLEMEACADFLRRYNEESQLRPSSENLLDLFENLLKDFRYSPPVHKSFRCCHVTFTPTRKLLEGPYPTQSNRIIRQYQGYEDHFVRVDFRGEDGLQFHWDRETDPTKFLEERVGLILKKGFIIGGRQFEILAYSNSALRQHSVWFINPFKLDGTWISGAYIRHRLGDFRGTTLLRCPSKYAARLSQAFTATDASVEILREEWDDTLPDMGPDQYLHTDGVGTISKALGLRIWTQYCTQNKRDISYGNQPSAYQIRFLGFKGVVAIDEQLDLRADGIHMRLRNSMKKFDVRDEDAVIAPLEIAHAFESPGNCYLNRPLVMLLEDVGVKCEIFQKLQDDAVADAKTIDDSITNFCEFLPAHKFGSHYGLRTTLSELRDRFGMDILGGKNKINIDDPFLKQVRSIAMLDVLRDIKHSARIPVPDSYLLVGVADEGPAYGGTPGYDDVFCLRENEIFACVQRPHEKTPFYIDGYVNISRSPVAHPGDVRRVRAIGKPPADRLSLFGHLKNVVVLPSVGERSLASCLGGGDVDGDLFAIVCPGDLQPTRGTDPASYSALPTRDLGRDSTIDDVCDFIVEYIHSDMVGLLSTRLLEIADQSTEGMFDPKCILLAEYASHALDFPKQGTPLGINIMTLPRPSFPLKPDWRATGGISYESSRALGHLFRAIDDKQITETPPEKMERIDNLKEFYYHPITRALEQSAGAYVKGVITHWPPSPPVDFCQMYDRYVADLRYICSVHALSNTADIRLLKEAEVVIGTMLGAPKDWKKDRKYRMRLQTQTLTAEVRAWFFANPPDQAVKKIWLAWAYALSKRDEFGANSFSWIVLGLFFQCLDGLN